MPKGTKPIKPVNTVHKNRIKEAIAKNNMTIPELAEKIGMKPSALRPYTRQERQPRLNLAEKIAKTCNLSVSFVLGVENHPLQNSAIDNNYFEKRIKPHDFHSEAVSKNAKLPLFSSHSMEKPINHIDSPPLAFRCRKGLRFVYSER